LKLLLNLVKAKTINLISTPMWFWWRHS